MTAPAWAGPAWRWGAGARTRRPRSPPPEPRWSRVRRHVQPRGGPALRPGDDRYGRARVHAAARRRARPPSSPRSPRSGPARPCWWTPTTRSGGWTRGRRRRDRPRGGPARLRRPDVAGRRGARPARRARGDRHADRGELRPRRVRDRRAGRGARGRVRRGDLRRHRLRSADLRHGLQARGPQGADGTLRPVAKASAGKAGHLRPHGRGARHGRRAARPRRSWSVARTTQCARGCPSRGCGGCTCRSRATARRCPAGPARRACGGRHGPARGVPRRAAGLSPTALRRRARDPHGAPHAVAGDAPVGACAPARWTPCRTSLTPGARLHARERSLRAGASATRPTKASASGSSLASWTVGSPPPARVARPPSRRRGPPCRVGRHPAGLPPDPARIGESHSSRHSRRRRPATSLEHTTTSATGRRRFPCVADTLQHMPQLAARTAARPGERSRPQRGSSAHQPRGVRTFAGDRRRRSRRSVGTAFAQAAPSPPAARPPGGSMTRAIRP